MKILQLVNRIPFPLNDGGNIGVHYYTEGFLEAGIELSMLAMNTTRHWIDIEKLPALYSKLAYFKAVKVDNRIKPVDALLNLFKKSSYNIDRFISRAYEQELIQLLQNNDYDVVQLEGLYLVPYIETIRKYSKAKITIRQHNIEFRIWERLTEQAKNPLKKAYLNLLTNRLKAYEIDHKNDYDLVLTISKEDDNFFKALGQTSPTFLHPFGIKMTDIPFSPASEQPLSLYHIGAMDWLPNQESVNWLLRNVMPLVIEKMPDVKLYLAGRNMPQHYFQEQNKNIVVLGEVPDAQAFERDKSILVVPLLSGGGIRIKIFQAMAMGKTIVTTSIGVEGIEVENGKEVFVADNAAGFAEKIIEITKHPQLIRSTGSAARLLIEQKYNRQILIKELLDKYKELINKQ
ncbi:glycosyltransferase [Taibaiella lutea]|uniref:Glycosyltransferase n=1 Tax=Taibaiella lutea TaxID=2608001 RepID=A0A5M6CPV2_9BACT|nr:glycosyltransferase family 4 protein [Taibaiella lutea]KAA5537328.1 glycosyltransferase [Taibaiella lutea]